MKKASSMKALGVCLVAMLVAPLSQANQENACEMNQVTWSDPNEKNLPCSSVWDYRTENTEQVRDEALR